MMKRIGIILVTLALCGGVAFSQAITDAYRYSQTDLNGTARYLGMGGAFGALGGDVSAMKGNPAGLAVYRSSEVVGTLSLNMVPTKANWLGTSMTNNRTTVSFDNLAYVGYFPTGNDEGIVGWNAGFAYNRLKNFRRNYSVMNNGGMGYSLSDYTAVRAYGWEAKDLLKTDSYDPYRNDKINDWQSILGYNAGFIDPFDDATYAYHRRFEELNDQGDWVRNYAIDQVNLDVYESGAVDQYDIAFGVNISDKVLLGATMTVTDINYVYESYYDEFFEYKDNDLFLDNGLTTDGTGYGFNLGVIVRPTDYLRLGVAYNSPTWYKMTDYYYGKAGSSYTFIENGVEHQWKDSDATPTSDYSDYEYRSPDKWLFSAALILGKSALLSVDYELTNYPNMRLYYPDGSANTYKNNDIKDSYSTGNTLRVGGEVKVTPQFSVRAGGAWSSSPVKAILRNGDMEVVTVGTIPNFTLDRGTANYTIGFGYRFTPNFYTDVACVFTNYKEDVYAFSNIFDEDGTRLITAQPARLNTNTTRVALTLGYKF